MRAWLWTLQKEEARVSHVTGVTEVLPVRTPTSQDCQQPQRTHSGLLGVSGFLCSRYDRQPRFCCTVAHEGR